MLLGHTCVCAVEIEPYCCRRVLLQRQRDGICCPGSPSGTMCAPSMEGRGGEARYRLRRIPVPRTSVPPAKGPGLPGSEAGCGPRCGGSWAKYDRATCSWKTHQFSLTAGDLEPFSETWPRWGTMRAGECYPLPMPSGLTELRASIICGSESGSRQPTPTASVLYLADVEMQKVSGNDPRRPKYSEIKRLPTLHGFSKDGRSNGPSGNELGRAVNRIPSIRKSDAERGGRGDLIQAVRGNTNKHFTRLGTPTKAMTERSEKFARANSPNPAEFVRRLQTPVADDAVDRQEGKFNSRGEPKLSAQVKRMPTCVASDGTRGGKEITENMTGQSLRQAAGGSLNPP